MAFDLDVSRDWHGRIVHTDWLDRVDIPHLPGACWLWSGATTVAGYGYNKPTGKPEYVHRLAYERWVGPIPEGLTIDHLCRVRACVNPMHLEPVTRAENTRRGLRARPIPHHGTDARYQRSCRCDPCMEASRAKARATYRRKTRAV